MIYFDNAATTKIHPVVWEAMTQVEQNHFFNAQTTYTAGVAAAQQIAQARDTLLKCLHATTGQLRFTSGATEANQIIINTKIKKPQHELIITAGDHNSVYEPAKILKDQGFCVHEAPLQPDGRLDISAAAALVTPQTALFIFSLVNSDTGTYQDAAALVRAIRARNPHVHIHADAAQAFGKFTFNVTALDLDSVTICAHKIHGPKGVGALWWRSGSLVAGHQGTLNNAGIIGFARAATLFQNSPVPALHDYLIHHLPAGCQVNGINNNPYITNLTLPGVFGETVLNALSAKGIYVGLGSACASHSKGNRTLAAMHFSPTQQKQVLRLSFGLFNTLDEVKTFLATLQSVLDMISRHDIF